MPRRTSTPYSGSIIAYLTAYICARRERSGFPRYLWITVAQRSRAAVRRDWGW